MSENGKVTRGVCKVDDSHKLVHIEETFGIEKQGEFAVGRNGKDQEVSLPLNAPVSMNLWGFTPDFLDTLERHFVHFLDGLGENTAKAEFLLPEVVGTMLKEGKADVTVLTSGDRWFGVTYKEDKPAVVNSFRKLIAEGVYKEDLYGDLG